MRTSVTKHRLITLAIAGVVAGAVAVTGTYAATATSRSGRPIAAQAAQKHHQKCKKGRVRRHGKCVKKHTTSTGTTTTGTTNTGATTGITTSTATTTNTTTTACTIPQGNGGDGDSDNNGGPTDGDGCK